jgi:Ca2+-binding EF-hand superfamily protein
MRARLILRALAMVAALFWSFVDEPQQVAAQHSGSATLSEANNSTEANRAAARHGCAQGGSQNQARGQLERLELQKRLIEEQANRQTAQVMEQTEEQVEELEKEAVRQVLEVKQQATRQLEMLTAEERIVEARQRSLRNEPRPEQHTPAEVLSEQASQRSETSLAAFPLADRRLDKTQAFLLAMRLYRRGGLTALLDWLADGNGCKDAEEEFRRYDENDDGLLNPDEMPEPLHAELDQWDTNHDRLIDLKEFKAFYLAHLRQETAASDDDSKGEKQAREAANQSETTPGLPVEEEGKPTVYRAGKLPKELPSWFAELDTDHDGQIGLYEWKASGRSLQEFYELDRNDDGFLTIDEVLHAVTQAPNQTIAHSTPRRVDE